MYYRLKVGYILDVVFEECVKNYATDHRLRIIDKIMRGVCGLDIWIKLMDTLTYLSWLVDLFHKRLKLNYSKYFTLNILLRYMQYFIKKWFLLNIEIGTYYVYDILRSYYWKYCKCSELFKVTLKIRFKACTIGDILLPLILCLIFAINCTLLRCNIFGIFRIL